MGVKNICVIKDGIINGGNVSFPDSLNYSKHYMDILKRFGDKPALIDGATGKRITFKDIVQQVNNIAASLIRMGVKPGDVVAICSENSIEFMLTVWAVTYIGAIANFINCAYSKDEIIHSTTISKPKYLFLSPTTYKKYYETLKSLGFIQKYFIYGQATATATSFDELVKINVNANSVKPDEIKDGSQTAIIVYSSGTTGLPKGARWTHSNLIVSCLQHICTDDDLVTLNIAPWTNTVGYILTTQMLLHGNTIVYLTKFSEETYLRTIEKYKVGFLIAVPPLVILLSKSLNLDKFNLSSLKLIICGGAPLESQVIANTKKRLPNLRHILQGYGMSEATGALTMETEEENNPGSVGKLVPGIIVKIVDVESRKILGPNQPGEVCLQGPALFGGYIGKDMKDDIDEDGFYKTGDIAYYDDEGYIFIVDRIKELIKYKSWQVAPSELEALILQHPAVKDVGVIGLPDSLSGELPLAFVVKQPGTNVSEKDIIDFVASKVSPWKQLRGGVRFVTEIPKNGSGKILRRQLRELVPKPKSKL